MMTTEAVTQAFDLSQKKSRRIYKKQKEIANEKSLIYSSKVSFNQSFKLIHQFTF